MQKLALDFIGKEISPESVCVYMPWNTEAIPIHLYGLEFFYDYLNQHETFQYRADIGPPKQHTRLYPILALLGSSPVVGVLHTTLSTVHEIQTHPASTSSNRHW